MKTEQLRPSSSDSYGSFSFSSSDELSTPNPRLPHHYTSCIATNPHTNMSNMSSSMPSMFLNTSNTPPHAANVAMSPLSSQSSGPTPPLSSSPLSPSEPLRNITNNPHLIHGSSTSSPLSYSILTASSSSSCNDSNLLQSPNQVPVKPTQSKQQSPPSTSHATPTKNLPKSSSSSPRVSSSETSPANSPNKQCQFSQEQIDCICDVLIQAKNFDKLSKFLTSLPNNYLSNDSASEIILRSKCEVAFSKGNFKEVYHLLETGSFNGTHHIHLQDMWYRAHYKEAERIRQRPLGES